MSLREWIKKQRLTLAEAADIIGISKDYLNHVAGSMFVPSVQLAKKIEEVTNGKVKATHLLGLKK